MSSLEDKNIRGTYYSKDYRYFSFELLPCDETKEICKSKEEVADYFTRNNRLQVIYNDGYIDLDQSLDLKKTSLNDF